MTDLRTAAQQALDVMSDISSFERWSEAKEALRAALAEPPTNQCGETCERAKLCAVCARALAEPVQEPVAWMDREGDLYKMPEIEGWAPPHTMLYAAPPQRKPLSVMDLQEALVYANLIDPDAIDDPENYDAGSTVAQIDELHQRLTA